MINLDEQATEKVRHNVSYELNKGAKALQNLTTKNAGGFIIGNAVTPIESKILVIAFEQGAATGTQAGAIARFIREAATKFPDVKVVIQFIP